MAHQLESLIDPEQLDKKLINKAFNNQKSLDIYMAFDDSIDTLMVMFKNPQNVDTATYNISDRLACVVNADSLEIVGFWLMRFSRFWIEMEEFEEIKAIWAEVVGQGLLSSYRKVQKKRHYMEKAAKKKDWGKNGKSEKVIKELFESKELQEELCLA